ncbi:hypothetical protein [Wolbachia endosymbiont of Ctenocephalides felis wCfeT]|uniref:hypothetical protein n=1 Tax=Wolbachia endosymbiont of Ctenocephalides felis wCfeT TaxID=2732593 RepID=UPI0014454969|nr:hypothetical protein [Wolbachia endosymbiont of Ctenocephalides felis wCfeT]
MKETDLNQHPSSNPVNDQISIKEELSAEETATTALPSSADAHSSVNDQTTPKVQSDIRINKHDPSSSLDCSTGCVVASIAAMAGMIFCAAGYKDIGCIFLIIFAIVGIIKSLPSEKSTSIDAKRYDKGVW